MKWRLKNLFAGLLILAPFAFAQPAPKPVDPYEQWGRLREYKVHGTVTVVLKENRKCYEATDITGVTDHDIILRFPGGDEYVLQDKEVLLLATGLHFSEIGVSEFLLSGRSSWLDVRNFAKSVEPKVRVVTREGKKVDGQMTAVTEDSISLKAKASAPVTLAKSAIQRVEIVRQKPMPKALAAMADETPALVPFNPQAMPYLLHWNDTIRVRIYDAALPEDNEPLSCE